jgi:hypothetical protein
MWYIAHLPRYIYTWSLKLSLCSDWVTGFDSRQGKWFFSLHHCVQTGSGAHPASCHTGTGDSCNLYAKYYTILSKQIYCTKTCRVGCWILSPISNIKTTYKNVCIMTTKQLMTGVETTAETSCTVNVPRTTGNIENHCGSNVIYRTVKVD